MAPTASEQDRFRKAFLLLLVISISAVFFAMIRRFLIALLLAAIFSSLAHPLYRRLRRRFGGREALASIVTLLIALLLVAAPVAGFLGIVASEAYQISQRVTPWIQEQIRNPTAFERLLPEWLPFLDRVQPYRSQILSTLGEVAGKTGSFLFNSLSAMTKGTVAFFFYFFIMLYAMFFFLTRGRELQEKVLYYTPLSQEDKEHLVERFVSVTRATLKGTLAIGVLQGALAGLAFAAVGIQGSAFWGTVMAVLSIIPGVGAALIWAPAVAFLLMTGKVAAGVVLLVWCAAVVGTIDNFLRPRLVGQDAKLPDLLILLATLGGIALFGAVGFLIGPIIAALFIAVWDFYGAAFKDVLTEPERGGG